MTLAELVIKMSADTASLRTDFDKAGKYAKDAAEVIRSAFAGIGAGLTVEGIGETIKSFAEFGETIARAAQKTGMAAEQISGLKFAAESTGTDFDVLTRGLAIFDRNVSGLANTNSQAAKAITALGVSTHDAAGHILPAHELLLDIAQRFQGMRDGAEKTAIAMSLFGRSGADLIPFLDRGAAGISELEASAKDLGMTLSGQDTRAAVQLKEGLHDLDAAMMGLRNTFVLTFSGSLVSAINDIAHPLRTLEQDVASVADRFSKLALGAMRLDQKLPHGLRLFSADDIAVMQDVVKQFDQMQTAFAISQQGAGLSLPGGGFFHIPGTGQGGKKKSGRDTGGDDDTYQFAPDVEDEGKQRLEAYYKTLLDFTHGLMMAQDPLAKYAGEMSKLNDALKVGIVTTGEYKDLATALGNDYAGKGLAVLPMSQAGGNRSLLPQFQGMSDSFKTLRTDAKQFGGQMSDSFVHMIEYGRGFNSMLQSMVTLFADFLIKTVLFKEIASSLGSMGGGSGTGGGIMGVLSSFFSGLAGGRATGGPVTDGGLYMVGETGPELFAPGSNGSIIPGDSLGGGGGNTVNIDARGAQPGVEHLIARAWAQMQKQIPVKALASTYEYHMRGGQL